MEFDASKVKNELVAWIRDWFEENGRGCNAIVGISGGKDSSCVAALCVEALGRDRVIGVLMPNGEQADIDMAELYYRSACPTRIKRVFLRAGDAIVMKQEELLTILARQGEDAAFAAVRRMLQEAKQGKERSKHE